MDEHCTKTSKFYAKADVHANSISECKGSHFAFFGSDPTLLLVFMVRRCPLLEPLTVTLHAHVELVGSHTDSDHEGSKAATVCTAVDSKGVDEAEISTAFVPHSYGTCTATL